MSDPRHPEYGQHWDLDQIKNLIGVTPATLDRVMTWLRRSGLDTKATVSATGDKVYLEASCSEFEAHFGVPFHLHQHRSGLVMIRSASAHHPDHWIPEGLGDIVKAVFGVSDFDAVSKHHGQSRRSMLVNDIKKRRRYVSPRGALCHSCRM